MGHVRSYGLAFVEYFANSPSRDAKQARKLVSRQSCRRQDILAQNLARMRRSSLSVVRHQVISR